MSGAIDNTGLGNVVDPLGIARQGLDVVTGKKSSELQGQIAQAQLEEQRRTRSAAVNAANSPLEINALQQALNQNEQEIARKQKLLDSADPALIESGRQALNLLKGQESSVLNPLKQNIAQQRLALQDRLKAQLGTGYANTTAGIQALSKFDQAAQSSLAGAQQQSLASLLGVAQNTSAQNNLSSNINQTASLGSLYGNIANRNVSAINATPITGSGAQFVSDLQQARNNTQLAGQLIQGGAAALTGAPTGAAAGASAPTGGQSMLGKNYSDFGYG